MVNASFDFELIRVRMISGVMLNDDRFRVLVAYANPLLAGTGFNHFAHALVRCRFGLADCRQRTIHGEVVPARD